MLTEERMYLRSATRRLLVSVLPSTALLISAVAPSFAQDVSGTGIVNAGFRSRKEPGTICPPANCPPAPCPAPAPPAPVPTTPTPDAAAPPQQPPEAAQAPSFTPEESRAAGGGETFAAAAPNIIGDLLYGGRSISFKYLRATGPVNVLTNGSTTLTNPSIAENNSPLPRDRVYFRFNHYDSAVSVTGISGLTTFAGPVGTSSPLTKHY